MRFLVFITLILIITSCGGKKPSEDDFLKSIDEAPVVESTVDQEMINAILQQIPSPLEISLMLKESGLNYNSDLLNSPDNRVNYNTNFQKAINLGIYGTDLGYTNIYEQNQDGLEFMAAIKDMADGLSIGQFFDIETIGKLASNSQNLDSLLLITTQNFNSINAYLQNQGRSNLSVLLLMGGWLEAMHITCQVANKVPDNKLLKEAIGEQQVVTESLKLLMDLYGEDPSMKGLKEDLDPLWAEFENVVITIEKGETTYEVVDGIMIINDNSTSSIVISDETFKNITTRLNEIRSKIIR
ncbi:MAG: hypothetical protein OEW75_05720 [Cyclobacteriaceae bacterium]|nr:hypothetical protein [Cyclobacteriaceae bacterium]